MPHRFHWRANAAIWLTTALLAACGGGGDAPVAAKAADPEPARVSRVESRIQTADAVQDVSRVKSRAASLAPAAARVALGPLPVEKSTPAFRPGSAQQIGAARDVTATATPAKLAANLQWQPTAGGGKVAAISFAAADAKGVRLGVVVDKLPGSATLRFYSPSRPGTVFQVAGQEVLQLLQRNSDAGESGTDARTYWSPEFGASEVTLEVELPAGTPAQALEIAVPHLSHIFVALEIPPAEGESSKGINDSESCNLDATCYGSSYGTDTNAVARMVFTQGGGSTYLCTGTLLNNRSGSNTPYFLSANHCISTQSAASSLQTDWFFRSAACNVRSLNSGSVTRYNGATLLYNSDQTDTSFMVLRDAPPAGATFAGWDASPVAVSTQVGAVHHPSGDLAKISFGAINGYATCSAGTGGFSCSSSGAEGRYLRVQWSQGTTEGGSSGGALFKQSGSGLYVVGTLRGGSASCSATGAPDFYGRFDVAYNAALKNWLDPVLPPAPGPGPNGRIPIYRFYNGSTGAHFFTASADERNFVINNNRSFNYEGTAFYAYGGERPGQSAVYRFYNAGTGAHFYTINTDERNIVQNNAAFAYEGPRWYAQTGSDNGSTPVYRFYKHTTGTHFYTINTAERDGLREFNREFIYEGVGYFAWTDG